MTSSKRRPVSTENPPVRNNGDNATPASIVKLMTETRNERQAALDLERIGDTLKHAREKRGENLRQIAEYLRIRHNFLVALENSRYDELPADAYVIGFLRTYANYLELDGKDAIDRYRREMAGRRKKPVLTMPTPITEGRTPSAAIMIGAGIAAILVYALWYGLSSSDRAVVSVPPTLPTSSEISEASSNNSATNNQPLVPPPALSVTQAPILPPQTSSITAVQTTGMSPITAAPVPTEASQPHSPLSLAATSPISGPTSSDLHTPTNMPAGQAYGDLHQAAHVAIHVEKECWVLIADSNGKTIFDHILKPGDVYNVPDLKGLTLTTGNGSGLILTLDGAELPRLADSSRVVRGVSLDPSKLKSLPQTPAE